MMRINQAGLIPESNEKAEILKEASKDFKTHHLRFKTTKS
jgi:hypothetical protein